ncbi:MAG: HIT family protein [Chloroflexi bacterium]|nr:HIT family protein [Chloroflexota bacterium]
MNLQPMDEQTREVRARLMKQVTTMQEAGECPTCHGSVYPPAMNRVIYEDEIVLCLLETYPRNPGHTIVMVKAHYNDISELPPEVAASVFSTIQRAIHALKTHLRAEKVYLCTMCDGKRNHLHFQLIPRLPGDEIRGSRLFVKERQLLTDYNDDVLALRRLMA